MKLKHHMIIWGIAIIIAVALGFLIKWLAIPVCIAIAMFLYWKTLSNAFKK